MIHSLAKLAVIAAAGFGSFLTASHSMGAETANGAALAEVWCASCHIIAETEKGPVLQGPPGFRTIARGGRSPDQLRAFLSHPHGAMPDLTLNRAEIDDLVAYIETFR